MKKVQVITSDERQKRIADYLKNHDIIIYENKQYVKGNFDAVVLPMTPNFSEYIGEFSENELIIGGRLSKKDFDAAGKNNIKLFDYFDNEYVKYENAFLTAEASIALAITNSSLSLRHGNCLVAGFGRIGKILTKLLKSFDCDITVTARKTADLALINALGHNFLNTEKITDIGKYNFIFNTIPHLIFDRKILDTANSNVFIADLASNPGGTDFEYAKSNNLKCIHALSLPNKISPDTDAEILGNSILKILSERS